MLKFPYCSPAVKLPLNNLISADANAKLFAGATNAISHHFQFCINHL